MAFPTNPIEGQVYNDYIYKTDKWELNAVSSSVAIGNWNDYTPTLASTGTKSVNKGKWRRIGDSMQIQTFARGSSSGTVGVLTISIPRRCFRR